MSTIFPTLLAKKSVNGVEPVTLTQHTRDVCDAAESLFGNLGQPTRLGEQWLRFFRLDAVKDFAEFANNLLAASLFHDWGKANQGMQDVLGGRRQSPLFRHEHLSVLLLGYDGVDSWVQQRTDIAWDLVLSAVGSHHLKFGDVDFAAPILDESTRVWTDHVEFQSHLLPMIAQRLNLRAKPRFPEELYWGYLADSGFFDPTNLRNNLRDGRLRRLTLTCRDKSQATGRMLNAVRSALIAADAVGSGLRRTGVSITSWVRQRFTESDLCDFPLIREVVSKRVKHLVSVGKWQGDVSWDGDGWNEFQKQCDTLPSRSLLLAPCGSGKTLAAWRWIASQVKQRPVKRVLFLYPTRATATEGFKDYVSWAPEADAGLMHGTADYDLDDMFPAEDPRSGRGVFNDVDPRLFSLRHWSKRVFSATVDQFFAFMSYGYGPMCLLPVLADSVIVVDEVHSFDRSMFSALLDFLKAFEVPVLCMTATMQAGRKDQITPLMEQVYEDRPGELAQIASAERYKVSRIEENEAEQIVREMVRRQPHGTPGKRVLWVVNQVSRAQSIARQLADIGVPLVCYHSRFKLRDRVDRHRETVGTIKAGQPAAVAISTQVCEMSLDIDADVLITEECPISSLIQRMGRCRRGRDELATKGPGEVFVYRPADEKVYSQDDFVGLSDFLTFLQTMNAVSQSDLERGLNQFGSKMTEAPKLSSFLTSGAYAVAGEDSFRDIEAFNVPAVLCNEVTSYLSAKKDKQPGFVVPVPRKLRPLTDPRLPRYLHVADFRHYDPKTGFWDDQFVKGIAKW